MAKVTVSLTDGTTVVTDMFVVSVSDNTAPMLLIDRARFNLVVGEKNYSVPVAVDPDGDVLSYKIQPGGDFPKDSIEFASVDISNNTLTLTPIAQGRDDVEITVSDGRGGNDQGSFNICVVPSNTPPRIAPMPSYIAVPVGAGTIAMPVLATDADGDTIFLFDVDISNSTVADIHYPNLGPYAVQEIYYHLQPCVPRSGGERSVPLFITPTVAGNTTVTINAQDAWGGKDTATFQIVVYEPTDPSGWRYEIPRDLFPYPGWNPSRFCC